MTTVVFVFVGQLVKVVKVVRVVKCLRLRPELACALKKATGPDINTSTSTNTSTDSSTKSALRLKTLNDFYLAHVAVGLDRCRDLLYQGSLT